MGKLEVESLHIAIIPDGNRRWAKVKGVSKREAYKRGIETFFKVLKAIEEENLPIKEVSIWGMSWDNYVKRSRDEIEELFSLFNQYLDEGFRRLREIKERGRYGVRFLGRLWNLPQELREKIKEIERSFPYGKFDRNVNFLLLYGGLQEVYDIAKKLVKTGKLPKDEEELKAFSYGIMPDVDIIIRTGGHKRLSGLLPLHSVYAEFFFLDKLWPDFTPEDLKAILDDFGKRERNFGR